MAKETFHQIFWNMGDPPETWRLHVRWHRTGWSFKESAMLVPRVTSTDLSERALSQAKLLKNDRVSDDHRQRTLTPSTTNLALRSAPDLCVPSSASCFHNACRVVPCFPNGMKGTDHRGVHSQVDTPKKERARPPQLQDDACTSGRTKSMLRTMTLVATLLTASLSMRAATLHNECLPPKNTSSSRHSTCHLRRPGERVAQEVWGAEIPVDEQGIKILGNSATQRTSKSSWTQSLKNIRPC